MTARRERMRWAVVLAATLAVAACSDAPTSPTEEDLDIEIVSGNGQRGLTGSELQQALVVKVTDPAGAPAAGVTVRFEAIGGGSVSAALSTTSTLGLASTRWTLGPAATRSQVVTASLGSGSASVAFAATALGTDETDLVVAHGALEGLTGFVLVRETQGSLDVLSVESTADTLLPIPPADAPGVEVVVFARGNRPLRVAPNWTSGIDTAHVTLLPPVAVDIDFFVQAGDFETRRQVMQAQLDSMEGIWRQEGMGATVGQVTFTDSTGSGGEINISSSGLCSGPTLVGAIRVELVSSIDGGNSTGWGCWNGSIFMGLGTERFPNLLAHELGHTFTLLHTSTGMMYASGPQREVREGEIFRAHFHQLSALNRIFGSQPVAQRRYCSSATGSPCLPETLDLNRPLIALGADARAAAPDEMRRVEAESVDAVGDEGRR